MNRTRNISLLALTVLALSGCWEEDDDGNASVTPAEPISIASLGSSSWTSPEEMTDTRIVRASDVLMANNMVVLDMSGSMGESGCSGTHQDRAEAAKAALLAWITANPGGNVGLIAFNSNEGPKLLHGLGTGEAHARQLIATIENLLPDAGTPLSTAIEMAEVELREQYVRQSGSGTYRMIVITDGEASSGYDPSRIVHEIAANPVNPIELHTIGFCIRGGHSLNDPNAVFYTDANSPQDLIDGLNATQGEATDFNAADLTFEEMNQ